MIENRLQNALYAEDLAYAAGLDLPWEKLKNKNFMITGSSGLIGTFLIDVLMYKNRTEDLGCRVYGLCRNKMKAQRMFADYLTEDGTTLFALLAGDVNRPLTAKCPESMHYILHLASNTHPVSYATEPIETISSNIIGTMNMLEFAVSHSAERFAFASSNEIYGENRGDTELFDESYLGYLDCNTLRAGYPEGKRCGEALCQAYKKQKGLDIVVPRLTRTIGPTLREGDSKASSQFLSKGLSGEDIVLKSKGDQYYSYTYVADAAAGLLYVILKGKNGEAYNIADLPGDIRLRDFAEAAADYAGTKVVFEVPDETEAAGFSKATKARLDGGKLKALGWNMHYDIRAGIVRTLDIMKQ